jgi:hypothetical protein
MASRNVPRPPRCPLAPGFYRPKLIALRAREAVLGVEYEPIVLEAASIFYPWLTSSPAFSRHSSGSRP